MKYEFVKANKDKFSIERICIMLSIERSGYYAWLKREPSKRELSNKELDKKILEAYRNHIGRYGSPRLTIELQSQGERCSKNRVARSMKRLNIAAKGKRKFRITTDSNHGFPVFSNLLDRDFKAEYENQKWCGDISYILTNEGWLYLATVIDLYSRKVIGWSLQSHMKKQLVCDALMMALQRRGFPRGVLFHSDRGVQYCSKDYQKILKCYEIRCSMSRRGNCWDNAVAESFFHSMKTELSEASIYPTREIAKRAIFQYIEVYYNRLRRHSSIGYISPEMFENRYKKVA